MSYRLGLFGARANNAGLGTQSLAFFRYCEPDATLVIDYSLFDGKQSFPERFRGRGVEHFQGPPSAADISGWLDRHQPDLVFTIETPYNHDLYSICRSRRIITVCQFNFEFLHNLRDSSLPLPDVLAAPTPWCLEQLHSMEQLGGRTWIRLLPVPVQASTSASVRPVRTFVHVAGYALHRDRNGTELLLKAWPFVKSQVHLRIHTQHDLSEWMSGIDPRIEIVEGNLEDSDDLYRGAEALVLPRSYGGLCLPALEAIARGLVVIMPECSPNWGWCHPRAMFPVVATDTSGNYPVAWLSPEILARQIDRAASWDEPDLQEIIAYQRTRIMIWDPTTVAFYREFFASHLGDRVVVTKPHQTCARP